MRIREICIALFLLIGIFVSCEKEDNFQSTGVITGPDVRFCACCGGYFIEIEDSTYNFETLPAMSEIDLIEDTFPINVNLDWTFDRDCGGIPYIEITKIEKR